MGESPEHNLDKNIVIKDLVKFNNYLRGDELRFDLTESRIVLYLINFSVYIGEYEDDFWVFSVIKKIKSWFPKLAVKSIEVLLHKLDDHKLINWDQKLDCLFMNVDQLGDFVEIVEV